MVSLRVRAPVPEFLHMSSTLVCMQPIANSRAEWLRGIQRSAMVVVLLIVMVTEHMWPELLRAQITDSQLTQTLFQCEFWIVMAVVLRPVLLRASIG
jgi:hypothetical protein